MLLQVLNHGCVWREIWRHTMNSSLIILIIPANKYLEFELLLTMCAVASVSTSILLHKFKRWMTVIQWINTAYDSIRDTRPVFWQTKWVKKQVLAFVFFTTSLINNSSFWHHIFFFNFCNRKNERLFICWHLFNLVVSLALLTAGSSIVCVAFT